MLTCTGKRDMHLHCLRCTARLTIEIVFVLDEDGSSRPVDRHANTVAMRRWMRSHAEPVAFVTLYDDEWVDDEAV